ncbi:formyltransferase family protein [Parapedobacter defluvii]|uniref:methionyl-tRNA formyltransferase n=1 Tax=Parapedobacter defluvii TaxID=2045106 RepID=UPI00334080BC
MNIAVLCNTDSLVVPALHQLQEKEWLSGVGIPEKNKDYLVGPLLQIGLMEHNITLIPADTRKRALKNWIATLNPTMVFVFGFPWKIPVAILEMPPKGFFNFHFGELPTYQGADPVFWQLRNREERSGLAVHRMTSMIDQGPIVWQEKYPMIPGETYGMHCQRMGLIAANMVRPFIEQMMSGKLIERSQQTITPRFIKKPGITDLSINWEKQSAEEIEWLINAANPKYGGACTLLRGREIRLLEVAPADIGKMEMGNIPIPGTIVYADAVYGLIVACNDKKFLKVNVVHLPEGYFSGGKLFSMGVKPGERFITD